VATEFDDRFDDKDVQGTLNAWRESAEKQADRPDWFWARQRALISSRIQEPQPRRMPALAWAGVAATVAVGVALILPIHKQIPPVAVNKAPVTMAATTSDSDLMQEVEETMNSGVPDSLQPASTLQQAMEKGYSGSTATKTKENRQ
jgi:hypothetical protein